MSNYGMPYATRKPSQQVWAVGEQVKVGFLSLRITAKTPRGWKLEAGQQGCIEALRVRAAHRPVRSGRMNPTLSSRIALHKCSLARRSFSIIGGFTYVNGWAA